VLGVFVAGVILGFSACGYVILWCEDEK
jgi:hypothetical protein